MLGVEPIVPTRVVAFALLVSACAGASDSTSPAPSPAPATSPSPAPATSPPPAISPTPSAAGPVLPAAGVRVTAPACGYGGSAPAVSVFVDVDSDVALTGVTVSFTLTDGATGAPGGVSGPPESLAVSPMDRGLLDFSTQGTTPFDGTIAAHAPTRLMYFSGLHEPPSGEAVPFGNPLQVNVVVHANEGSYAATCNTAEMWPSS